MQYARFIGRLHPRSDPAVLICAAVLSAAVGRGDVCLDLAFPLSGLADDSPDRDRLRQVLPEAHRLQELLSSHPAVAPSGRVAPMVLDDRGRLYLYRYWAYERRAAEAFSRRGRQLLTDASPGRLSAAVRRLFPESVEDGLAGQSLAAATAALKPLCVISGGPGTGKTTAAARIAALLLSIFDPDRFRILLAAPTGKAAARLREAMAAAARRIDCPEAVRKAIPTEAKTLHRLLEPLPGRAGFRRHRENPLPADAVIVDEASMIDLSMMSRLVDAVPDHSRLILMGDRDQLASVDAGAVLGDLCGRRRTPGVSKSWANTLRKSTGAAPSASIPEGGEDPALGDAVVLLTRNFRFSAESGIGRFSRRVQAGDWQGALEIARRPSEQEPVVWIDARNRTEFADLLKQRVHGAYGRVQPGTTPEKALELASSFKILCAVNRGPFGVGSLNDLSGSALRNRERSAGGKTPWYPGRPVMITRNDYSLELFNGDLGVALEDSASGDLRVFFPSENGGIRAVSPHRIADHQTAYAMTVHKSQGSEFDEVLLVLPEKDGPVLTRELIYTAATRARRRVVICGTAPILAAAVARRVDRTSGLLDALWGAGRDVQRKEIR